MPAFQPMFPNRLCSTELYLNTDVSVQCRMCGVGAPDCIRRISFATAIVCKLPCALQGRVLSEYVHAAEMLQCGHARSRDAMGHSLSPLEPSGILSLWHYNSLHWMRTDQLVETTTDQRGFAWRTPTRSKMGNRP